MVNLGAGSDTWFWNLVDEGRAPRKAWIEVDFAECTARKIQCIRSRKQLLEKIKSDGNLKLASRFAFFYYRRSCLNLECAIFHSISAIALAAKRF